MENFELLRNVTIGQYIPTDSVVHRLDPRAKLLIALAFACALSFSRSIVVSTLLVLMLLACARIARLPIPYVLRGLRPVLPLVLFLMVFQLLFQGRTFPCDTVYFEWRFIVITPCLLQIVVRGALRVVAFLFLFSLLTMTTSSSDLAHGAEALGAPLKRVGIPVHELSLTYLIALRFVPTLADEADRVAKAQASRGGGFAEHKRWRVDRTARARLPLLVPLFVNALRRGEELIVAMEARGYLGAHGRTNYVRLHSRPLDWILVVLAFLVAGLVWWVERQ